MKGEYHSFHIAAKLPDSLGAQVRKLQSNEMLTDTQILNEAVKDWIKKKQNPTTDQSALDMELIQTSLNEVLDNLSSEEAESLVHQLLKTHERKKRLNPDEGGYRYQRKSVRLSEQISIQRAQEIKETSRMKTLNHTAAVLNHGEQYHQENPPNSS